MRPAENDHVLLIWLITRIFEEENNLDITLADVSSMPSPDVYSDDEKPQDQVSCDSFRS